MKLRVERDQIVVDLRNAMKRYADRTIISVSAKGYNIFL